MENITTEQALEVLKKAKADRLEVAQSEFKIFIDSFCKAHECSVVPTIAVVGHQILQSGFQIILND